MKIFEQLEEIRKLAIIALFTDDNLMNVFVLKGGNALEIGYKMSSRSSIDVDVSMEEDFESLEEVFGKLEKIFKETYKKNDYVIFDFAMVPKPKTISEKLKDFWGGYQITYKVIEQKKYDEFDGDLEKIRKQAIAVGAKRTLSFRIDISKYEYCKTKDKVELEGNSIFLYTPEMIIYEKLRAICQQMEEYRKIVDTNQRKRARDFYDINKVTESFPGIELNDPDNLEILKGMFEIKKVPIEFLSKIKETREFHRVDFQTVENTVTARDKLESYDYYFDDVVRIVKGILKSLGIE